MSEKFRVTIKPSKKSSGHDYTCIHASDKLEAFAWGERQAKVFGYEDAKIEVHSLTEQVASS
jgi:hypothetical protein